MPTLGVIVTQKVEVVSGHVFHGEKVVDLNQTLAPGLELKFRTRGLLIIRGGSLDILTGNKVNGFTIFTDHLDGVLTRKKYHFLT